MALATRSRIRSVQRTDGADHECFTSLLWADGYAVGDGTAQNLRHGIGILGGVEVQPGTLGVLFQQALALKAAADAAESSQDIPIAISALGEQQLEDSGFDRMKIWRCSRRPRNSATSDRLRS